MSRESKFQSEVANYLRGKGAFVMVIQPQAGIPTGTPDIFFCKGPIYGWLECKKSQSSPFQPLQKLTLEKLNGYSYARAVWPANWPEVRAEIEALLSTSNQ